AFPPRSSRPAGDEVLRVEHLSLGRAFDDVSFSVRAREIVRRGGLVGAGRSEVLETVYGARRRTSGTVTVDGDPLPPGNVTAAVPAGVGLPPGERKSQA